MPSTRSSLKELSRLLDAVAEPIYVVDATGCIVYVNAACAAWLECDREQILGLAGQYTSSTSVTEGSTAADVANALCPPPEVFHGKPFRTTLLHPSGNTRRQVSFLPLRLSRDELQGILAILSLDDEPPESAASAVNDAATVQAVPADDSEATLLHQQLRRFRQKQKDRYGLERLIGDSPAMSRVRSQVSLAAQGNTSVLIVGPPGTICEHVARAIHLHCGPHADARFVPLAGTQPGELLLSTMAALFKRSGRKGHETAPPAGGTSTLFLDSAELLTVEVQEELRQWMHACPQGMRVISAVRQPLGELAKAGDFDAQLAALLATLTVEIPPLSQRPEDIPLLAQLFLEEANAEMAKQLGGFTAEAMDALAGYPWPRDVDELDEMVRAAHRHAKGAEATVRDLPERIALATDAAVYRRPEEQKINLEKYLKEIEMELLQRAIKRAKGNKTKAAHLLGMTRPRLYRRLVQLGLEKPPKPKRDKRPPQPPDEQVDFQEG